MWAMSANFTFTTNIMSPSAVLLLLVSLAINPVFGNPCGGLLQGEHGYFSLPSASDKGQSEPSNSSCLWIIQLHYRANIRFKLESIEEHSHLKYPEDQLTACTTACNYTKLNSTHIGSSVVIPGKTLIVILPNASSFTSFSWEFVSNDNSGVEIMKNSDYVNSPRGLLKWKQLELEERMTWAINPSEPVNIQWNLDITTSCNASDNCACVYFAIFQLTSEGILSEDVRTCGQSLEGKLETIKARFVVLIKVNTKVEANRIVVSWGVDAPVPPVPTAGLFAATSQGLISLNLQTFEARTLTSQYTLAVAVNHNLEKVYWSQSDGNYNIMRSNFDGSAKEVIIPGQVQADRCFMLAIEESSGNIYFGLYQSHQITVCNALGKNCTVYHFELRFSHLPLRYSFRLQKWLTKAFLSSVMYWGKRGSPCALVRANLDGSNAKIISTDFANLRGIALKEPTKDTIYWADYTDNTIGTLSINGGNKRTIIELDKNPGPFGIQVDAHKIYFGNYHSGTIQSANKDSGGELTPIFNSTGNVRYLALFKELVQQSVPFPSSHNFDQKLPKT